jgi:DNA-binding MarR family transcriptional regulator
MKQRNTGGKLSGADLKTLKGFALVLEEFRKHDPEVPVQTVLAFIYAIELNETMEEGPTIKEIGDKLGVSTSSASRNIMAHCEVNRLRKQGYGTLETYEDPLRRIQKKVRLTPKGERVLQSVLHGLS